MALSPRRAARRATAAGPAATFATLAALAALALPPAARAHADPSAASELSALPVALSVAAPASVLVAGASFVVATVTVTAEGVVWVLERVGDGLRVSVTVAGRTLGTASELVGGAVAVTTLASGTVLSCGPRVIAFIPATPDRDPLFHREVAR